MRKVIEWAIPWIHNAISGLHGAVNEKVIIDDLTTVKKALVDALVIGWESPEQYGKRTGEPLRDDGMVWIWIPGGEKWESYEYWQAKQIENDLLRLDKDFDAAHDPLAVFVFNGPYPPKKIKDVPFPSIEGVHDAIGTGVEG